MSGYSAFARYYDTLTANVDYRGRAAYFHRLVGMHAPQLQGGLLLDLACGTGSLSTEFVSIGYDVIGADASPEMLTVAMQKASENGHRVLFLHQEMGGLDLYGTVDVTVCALDSFNHLPDEGALCLAIANVGLFTVPGGLLLFDLNTHYKHREILANNVFVYEPDGLFCVWQNIHCPEDDSVAINLDFFAEEDDGSYTRSSEMFCERVFSRPQLDMALEGGGFELVAVYDGDTVQPPGETTQRKVYVAQKKENI